MNRNVPTSLPLWFVETFLSASFDRRADAGVAKEYNLDVKRLIVEVAKKDRKSPSENLMRETARRMLAEI